MPTVATRRLAPPKRLLYGPGPAMVDPRAAEAMSAPAVGIRDPYFLEIIREIQSGLRTVFGTGNLRTFPLPSGGSGGMEAAVTNFLLPGSTVAIFAAGHFADRMSVMAERQKAKVVRLEKPWGETFSSDEAADFIAQERPDVVGFVQAETSTGAYQDAAAIVPPAEAAGALVLMDCVTSLGAMPVELDRHKVDVAFSCSQKGLSAPAGLSPFSLSERAWEWLSKRPTPPATWYFDLALLAKYFEPPNVYHHTPSTPLYYALHQALASIEEEGLRARWNRHRLSGERLLPGLLELGFTPLVKNPEQRLWHLTTVTPPPGLDEALFRQRLLDRHNIEVAGGLGQLAGKILRIGTMGPLSSDENVDILLAAMKQCM